MKVVLVLGLALSSLCFANAQTECPANPPNNRMSCALEGGQCPQSKCCKATNEPRCYINTAYATSATSQAVIFASQQLEYSEPDQAGINSFKAVAEKAGNNIPDSYDVVKRKTIAEGRNFNFGTNPLLGLAINFPECPVKVPFCHRTPCASHRPDAESNPFSCYSDPRCCFDKELYIYRSIFGPGFMDGASVCHHGPTSALYWQIASSIRPWNAFFQKAIADVFESYFDTVLNLNTRAICAATNLFNGFFFSRGSKCGWEGITKKECQLRGCCYDSNRTECNYPKEDIYSGFNYNLAPGFSLFPGLSSPQNLYPELYAREPREAQCQRTNDYTFHPSIFRRLPCRCPEEGDEAWKVYLQCPRSCCKNPFALVPQLADLSILTGQGSSGGYPGSIPGVPGFPGLPGFPGIPGFSGLPGFSGIPSYPGFSGFPSLGGAAGLPFALGTLPSGLSLADFYCPYKFYPIPGLPDLTDSVNGCCKQHACYHKKRAPPSSWGSWGQWRCNVQCGSGQETRSRQCSRQGSCSGTGTQSRSCVRPSCATWSNWQQWSGCNKDCGNDGAKQRYRQCYDNGQQSSRCPGLGSQSLPCNRRSCASWSIWEPWRQCNGLCGRTGRRVRSRACQDNGQSSSGCSGSGTEEKSCQVPPCSWGGWGSWNPCDNTCTKQRSLSCSGAQGQSVSSNYCGQGGGSSERSICQSGPCNPNPNDPGVNWSGWSQWTSCARSCGNENRRRVRRCLYDNDYTKPVANKVCECVYGNNYMEETSCNLQQCGPTYAWSDWSSYTPCSKTCGPGSHIRSRRCFNGNQQVNSQLCPGDDTYTKACNEGECSKWSAWSDCSATCRSNGNGEPQQFRYSCKKDNYTPDTCPPTEIAYELRSCNNIPC